MNHWNAASSIASTFKRAGSPLTEDQTLLLAGSMTAWLDEAYEEGRLDQAKLEIAGREKFLRELTETAQEQKL